MSAPQALASRIEIALTDPLTGLGFDVEAVEVTPAGKRRVVRVAVDKDGGVTMDDVADATRVVADVLDTDLSSAMGQQPYTLEVTSRGVDRPLTLPRHWRRNRDRLVKVTLTDGTSLTGHVTGSDEDAAGGVVLEVAGEERRVPYADVDRALVQVEFNRKPTGPQAEDHLHDGAADDDDEVDDDMDDDDNDVADEAEGDR